MSNYKEIDTAKRVAYELGFRAAASVVEQERNRWRLSNDPHGASRSDALTYALHKMSDVLLVWQAAQELPTEPSHLELAGAGGMR